MTLLSAFQLCGVTVGAARWIASDAQVTKRTQPTSKPSPDPLTNNWTCFRRSFALETVPPGVSCRIACDSKYWLWVNDQLVIFEGGLKRGPNRTDSYVDVVDLTRFLKEGKNTIAVLAWYFGREGFSHLSSGMPGFYFDSDAHAVPDSDGMWKATEHRSFGNTNQPLPNFRLPESNIRFDARRSMGGWRKPEYDDSGWSMARELGKAGDKPWGKLHERPIPMWRISELREYGTVAPPGEPGKPVVARLPYDAQVTPYLKVDAPAGLTIDIRTDTYVTGEPTVRAEYVTRAGEQEFETPGWMSGHEVHYLIPKDVSVIALKYRESGYDADLAGSFHCDDDFYNQLWKKGQRTIYVNMRDTYFDCPDRERAQWWGDITIDVGQAFYALDRRSDLLAAKGLRELANWQRKDGTLYSPIPDGNWNKELPMQSLAAMGWYGAWNYYLNSGDAETLKAIYPALKRYLDVWKFHEDGLVVHRAGEWDWLDWGTNIDVPPLDNAWYFLALKSAAGMAKVTGNDADLPIFDKRMKAIQASYDKAFWSNGEYRSKDYKGDTDDRANAMAILSGLAPLSRHEAVQKVLREHHNASPGMEKYVLEAQCRLGDAQGALERMKKRFKPMVESHLTTLWEFWDLSGSYNHPWGGGTLTVLSQYIAGIAPTSAGWETFEVRPRLGHLKQVDATVITPRGKLTVSLRREGKWLKAEVDAPSGTRGTIVLLDESFAANPGLTRAEVEAR